MMSYLHSEERNIVRKIYGPVKEEEREGIRMNKELQHILQEADTENFIKLLGLRWYAHVEKKNE
jgi:hypothetical protein